MREREREKTNVITAAESEKQVFPSQLTDVSFSINTASLFSILIAPLVRRRKEARKEEWKKEEILIMQM